MVSHPLIIATMVLSCCTPLLAQSTKPVNDEYSDFNYNQTAGRDNCVQAIKVISQRPHCLLINYAIGGISGLPIGLERYGNAIDMYVEYVRVYEKK
ncbi:hypothetical protein BH10PLA1_BH10PLA1_02800 [soil metagenome]